MTTTLAVVVLFLTVAGIRVWRLDGEKQSATASLLRALATVASCVAIWMIAGNTVGLPDDSGAALGLVLLGVTVIPTMLATKARLDGGAS